MYCKWLATKKKAERAEEVGEEDDPNHRMAKKVVDQEALGHLMYSKKRK